MRGVVNIVSKLIILRGNSGSGKTTIANKLRCSLAEKNTMLVSQDTVRLEILNVKDHPGNPSIELIEKICEFGKDRYDYVILEGILGVEKYQKMLFKLCSFFENNVLAYYLDIPFSETLRRNNERNKERRFDIELLKKWWLKKDYLHVNNERVLTENLNQAEIISLILNDLKEK